MWQKYLYTERFKQDNFKEKVKCIAVTQLLSQSNSLPLRGGPEFVLNLPSQITSRVPAVWKLEPGIMLLNVGKSFHAEYAASLTGPPETRLLVRRDFDDLSHASLFFFPPYLGCMAGRTAFLFHQILHSHASLLFSESGGRRVTQRAGVSFARASWRSLASWQHVRNIHASCFQHMAVRIPQTDSPGWWAAVYTESDQSRVFSEVALLFVSRSRVVYQRMCS